MNEEKNPNAVVEPVKGNQPPTGVVEPPAWLSENFKGDTVEDRVKNQAKAYHDAVRGMSASQQEAAELRRQIAEVKEQYDSMFLNMGDPEPVDSKGFDPEEKVKKALEEKYGMPFNELKALHDVNEHLLSKKLKPILDNINEAQFRTVKTSLSSQPFFKDFEAEIDRRLADVPLEEKVKSSRVQQVYDSIIAEKFRDGTLVDMLSKNSGEPAAPPSANVSGKAPELKKGRYSEAQYAFAKTHGVNLDGITEKESQPKVTGWEGMVDR